MLDIPDELFERCLRALHHAPADKPSMTLLLDMHGDPEGLKAALALAFQAGVESIPWAYSARKSSGKLVNFESIEAAFNFAAPVDGYPQLPVLRQRRGPWEQAVFPDV